MTAPPIISIPLQEPTSAQVRRFDFAHIPKLGPFKPGDKRGSLLPEQGGRPGLTYAQIPLKFARQAEAAGWFPMFNICRYTIVGPKGSIDMELMAQGKLIGGLSSCSTKCICRAPIKLICAETGLDPTTGFPFELKLPVPTPNEATTNDTQAQAQAQVEVTPEDPGLEAGSQPQSAEPQDPQGEAGQPEPDQSSGSRKGRRGAGGSQT